MYSCEAVGSLPGFNREAQRFRNLIVYINAAKMLVPTLKKWEKKGGNTHHHVEKVGLLMWASLFQLFTIPVLSGDCVT